MSRKARFAAAGGVGVVALSVGVFALLAARGDVPLIGNLLSDDPPVCSLSGAEPSRGSLATRPAVAVKVENSPLAYPLSGLEDAEVVYEELVEGGMTRFMAVFQCTDSGKIGPVRSARVVDPDVIRPITKILAYSGQNDIVLAALEAAGIVRLDETSAQGALSRVERPGISSEHTLYGDTKELRRLGSKKFDEPPPADLFEFGELIGGSKKAASITINFSAGRTISYAWSGTAWLRSEAGEPFMSEAGSQIAVDNVLIEEHVVNNSKKIIDAAGNPSVEIADVTGSGKAVLFRDGRVVKGRWERASIDDPVVFKTKAGDAMVFAPGSIWIELLPSAEGEVKGSFAHAK